MGELARSAGTEIAGKKPTRPAGRTPAPRGTEVNRAGALAPGVKTGGAFCHIDTICIGGRGEGGERGGNERGEHKGAAAAGETPPRRWIEDERARDIRRRV